MIHRGPLAEMQDNAIVIFQDTFLLTDDMQLRLQFDSLVTSYRRVTNDKKTEAIGKQYPYVERNTAAYYKTFNIGGKIFSQSDIVYDQSATKDPLRDFDFYTQKNTFMLKKEIYDNKSNAELYRNYNKRNDIHSYDYVYEREYREKVLKYLTEHHVFLLRTLTEGNILVKLSEVSLKPESELANYVYSFTATATEIDECNVYNYYKYNILNNSTALRNRLLSKDEEAEYSKDRILVMYQDPNDIHNIKLEYQDTDKSTDSLLHSGVYNDNIQIRGNDYGLEFFWAAGGGNRIEEATESHGNIKID